ncbi:MAG: flagellar protein FlaI [Nitrosopumilaceae archaeon]|nr:flagellar protein FlaI [Nitrososphaerota archaeon]NDF35808.1 flagellar protein FlaI [Nitrosopumilaceae archaeon]
MSATENLSINDPEFLAAAKSAPHLADYVSMLTMRGYAVPTFVKKLEREHGALKEPNLIYPLSDTVFVHINSFGQLQDGYKEYVIVEPASPDRDLQNATDRLFATQAGTLEPPVELTERFNVMEQYLNNTIQISKKPIKYDSLKLESIKKIPVYEKDIAGLRYHFLRKRAGLDLLDPFLMDPHLEDVSIIGAGNMYVVHKVFGSLKSSIYLGTEEIDDLIIGMSEQFGKTISHAKPVVDAQLPEGSRINIVYGKDVSRRGTNATIRRFANVPLAITQIVQSRTMNSTEAAYLWMMLSEGMSMFINGETASGKTTTLMGITSFIPSNLKIITIEDTAEITLPHPNWISEVTRDAVNVNTSVTMFDLLKAALRQRPNYIMIGEIRGAEGNTAFQAMQTGHPVISTFHAGTMNSFLQRLTNPPIAVPKTHVDNLNIALFQAAVHGPDGKRMRRVLTINEILGYNGEENKVMFVPVFNWEPSTDTVRFRGRGSSALFQKILGLRGMSRKDEGLLYDELAFRAKIIEKMIEKKIFNFYDVFDSMVHCKEVGLEAFMKELEAL